jgi:hypothetical protein
MGAALVVVSAALAGRLHRRPASKISAPSEG